MISNRSAGILLHISSLPGEYGIGTMGKEAYGFVRLLSRKNIRYWQILPLVQTGYGDSPYQSVFSGSGNPYFIDFDILIKEGLLTENDVTGCKYEGNDIDYAFLYDKKYAVLRRAFSRFDCNSEEFTDFVKKESSMSMLFLWRLSRASTGNRLTNGQKNINSQEKVIRTDLKKKITESIFSGSLFSMNFSGSGKLLRSMPTTGTYILSEMCRYM